MQEHLVEVEAGEQSFWYRWLPFHGELRLRHGSLDEIEQKTADANRLIRRHGLPRVIAFYEEQLLPALDGMPENVEVWSARHQAGCQLAQMYATTGDGQRYLSQVARLIANLPREKSQAEARRQWRAYLRQQLAQSTTWMRAHGLAEVALRAYELCEQIGELTPEQRAAYADLLWRKGDRGPQAMRVYLRHLTEQGWRNNGDPQFNARLEFVLGQLGIDEQSPEPELRRRLFLNQLALCGAEQPPLAARNAGLGYLRLSRPDLAIDYLRRPAAAGDTDGGLTPFYLGQAYFQTNDYDRAATAFEQAMTAGYNPARIASWQGVAYAKIKRWADAVETFRRAEAGLSGALDSEFYLQWGRASFLMRDVQESERRFRQAIAAAETRRSASESTSPPRREGADHWRAGAGLAVCLEQQGRRAEAITLLDQVTSQENCGAPAFYLLGRLLEAEGRTAEAKERYGKAVEKCKDDLEYQLAFGLALDDLGDPDGLPPLEKAARAGIGGAEVLRRVAVGYFQAGERTRARRWLRALSAAEPDSPTIALFDGRDRASEATEAFNAGRYSQAAALWEQAFAVFSGDGRVAERLALAISFDAAAQLTGGGGADIWPQVERAQSLAPCAESRFLYGFSQLVNGDFAAAQGFFAALAADFPEHTAYPFFRHLAAYFAGDEAALEHLAQLGPVTGAANLNSLLAFLQIQLAVLKGAFEQAAEKIREWTADPEAVRGLGLPSYQINALAALCLTRGQKTKKQRIVVQLENLNEAYRTGGAGYWDLAIALAKHHVATLAGVARAAEAKAEELDQCAAAYRALLGSAEPAARLLIQENFAGLLRFQVCHRVAVSDIGGALAALYELALLPIEQPREVAVLRDLLTARLAEPSHEKAYALLHRDGDAARAVWLELLERDAGDFMALQHLACLAWSRAYDEVLAERLDASLPFWREGLEWYRQLYAQSAYWESLRAKGQVLGQMPGSSFDEQAFAAWQSDALYQQAHTLLDLITTVLAGYDPAKHGGELTPPVRFARELVNVIRESKLPE